MERVVSIDSNGKIQILNEESQHEPNPIEQTKSAFDLVRKWKTSVNSKGKPSNTPFHQQKMKSWQPILVPKTILPVYFILGLTFLTFGTYLYLLDSYVVEVVINYTDCDTLAGNNFSQNGVLYPIIEWKFDNSTNICTINFELEKDINGPVEISYGITNIYQNHRRYLQSFNARQLLGDPVAGKDLFDCAPFDVFNNTNEIVYYPCGLIANSFFNDSFSSFSSLIGRGIFPFSEKGIAFDVEKEKVKNTRYQPDPDGIYRSVVPPPNWKAYGGRYTNETIPKLEENEHFIVWMRAANFANFRKPYGYSNSSMTQGIWQVQILSIYPVRPFFGTKSLVVGNKSWLGHKNNFLGIAYVSFGVLSLLIGSSFMFFHVTKPRRTGDKSHLSWEK